MPSDPESCIAACCSRWPVCGRSQGQGDLLASSRFDAIDILSLIVPLALVVVANNLAKIKGWPVPPAVMTMGVGLTIGALSLLLPERLFLAFEKLDRDASQQFLTVWLAPIIFAEGYALKTEDFFDNIARILCHAFLGTAVSTIVVAYSVLHLAPILGVAEAQRLNFAECLTFGAMISATDPVTTLAIFKEQRLAQNNLGHLYYSVMGESVLNDAVGITLFSSFSQLVLAHKDVLDTTDVVDICLQFVWTFLASMVIGGLMGLVMSLALKHAPLKPSAHSAEEVDGSESEEGEELQFNVPEIGVAFVLAMSPYFIAEALNLSGIVAIMFSGMVAKWYAHYNLTRDTRLVFLPTVELIAQLCETYVFIILGLGVCLFPARYSASLIAAAVLGCLLGRAAHVYPLSWAVNALSSSQPLPANEQHMLWFAGLRGAIAFICAFSFPEDGRHGGHRYTVICTTTAIVGASLLLLGWPTSAMMRFLDIRARDPPERLGPHLEGILRCQSYVDEGGSSSQVAGRLLRSQSEPLLAGSPLPAAAAGEGRPTDGSPGNGGGGTCWPGLRAHLQRLDGRVRRFLMTRDALIERNATKSDLRLPSPGAGSPGPPSRRSSPADRGSPSPAGLAHSRTPGSSPADRRAPSPAGLAHSRMSAR